MSGRASTKARARSVVGRMASGGMASGRMASVVMASIVMASAMSGCRSKAPQPPAGSAPVEARPAQGETPGATGGQPATPPPPAPVDEGTAEQLQALERANAALDRDDEASALAEYTRAAAGPVTGAAISATLAAAELHDTRGRPAEARALYQRAVEIAPQMAEIRYAAGRFFAGLGESPLADVELREAIRLQPDFLPSYPALAGVLSQSGQPEAAAALLLAYEQRLQALTARLRDPARANADRIAVVDLFALLDDERATRALIDALADPSPHIRLAAADALTFDPDPEALIALARAVEAEADPIAKRALAASLRRAQATVEASMAKPAPPPAMPKPGQ
ncbi:MAG: HEAT repeat domain-containing protein [Myxococcales bacterium]|nr:HEAT repeat domain-containing protein [Myxococcales bacterium]